ncbi:hypothetical protein KKH05_03295 [Patescibacteria group bacterium]|nr:hypothetical protein [Patescibacteria group bacterium]
MKPQISIGIIVLIFVGAFVAYSNLPQESPQTTLGNNEVEAQANIENALDEPTEEALRENSGKDIGQTPNKEIKSTTGLDEELKGFVDGFDAFSEEWELLEPTSTPTQ